MNIKTIWLTRFDLFAKLLYLRFLDLDSEWGREVYTQHLKIWNNFRERKPKKKTREDFINSFDALASHIKLDTFDWSRSPIETNDILVNGIHRLAAAIFYRKIYKTRLSNEKQSIFNYKFFIRKGLESKYLDSIIFEAFRYIPNLHIAISSRNLSDNFFGEYLLYKKEIAIFDQKEFIKKVYSTESWIGNIDSVNSKMIKFFKGGHKVYVYVFMEDNIRQWKENIRKIFSSKHIVHSSEDYSEAFNLAGLLLNENSLSYNFNPDESFSRKFNEFTKKYQKYQDRICIDSGMVLGLLGIREPKDVDFIIAGRKIRGVKDHNPYLKFYGHSADDIVYNPLLHFYYRGWKFTTLDILKGMKKRRKESKDLNDLLLVRKYEKSLLASKQAARKKYYWRHEII